MPSPIVSNCCCCSLRSGGIMLGWFFLIIDSMGIVLSIALMLTKFPIKWYTIFWMVVYCLSWISYVPWLVGIYSKKTSLMIIGIVWSSLYILIEIANLGFTIAGVETSFWFSLSNNSTVRSFLPELSIIGAVFGIALSAFVFIVSYSLYISMTEADRRRQFPVSNTPPNNLNVQGMYGNL